MVEMNSSAMELSETAPCTATAAAAADAADSDEGVDGVAAADVVAADVVAAAVAPYPAVAVCYSLDLTLHLAACCTRLCVWTKCV